ncbi:A24 family peptidase [Nitrosovibrio sp. Nv17]|jgi:leader peptidase (prepilin peptidase)/N-methyltransferase|uniref:prepilin peptidase n=1 Tax=Nitrosovibrio sp. Nv17 TaxID=1855339 RepID=UPI000908F1D6|nr:A24 family peptidase [Nitrosovibrio sp. Nv17]SFW11424.1 type 4 prepilin peptidase 1 Aspartic peptidase. MEROPS family A24A [Nitrosovibrio sp. Nv17]
MPLNDFLQHSPAAFISLCTVVGLAAGSFLNVVIHRLPEMMRREWMQQCAGLRGGTVESSATPFNLCVPRSACPHCGHTLRALENIPVASYVWLGGRCSRCRASISLRYPAVEILTASLSGLTAAHLGYGPAALMALVFVWGLIALAFIDARTQLLPDGITLPLLWAGLLASLEGGLTDPRSAVIGAAAGYLALWLIYWCFRLATGREGMGHGDFKLLAMIGAWLGWQMLPLVILLASLAGAAAGIGAMAIAGRDHRAPLPFGPYLAGAGGVALFWGDCANRAWLGWSGLTA